MKQIIILLISSSAFLIGSQKVLGGDDTISEPYPGVRYIHRHVKKPREIDMHIVIVDLNNPGITIKTTGPNRDRKTETDYETTRQFVKRIKARIGINGGFFEYNDKSRRSRKGNLVSLAVSDGKRVSPWGRGQRDAINLGPDNSVTFIKQAEDDSSGYETIPKVDLYNAIAGNLRLIRDGKVLARGGNPTYPQTAVGHTADHKLILFVSDGRQKGFSEGMMYVELANVLKELGAVDAIAFDGGGSATMVMKNSKNRKTKVLNRPSDGKERAVGNNLGILIK